MMEIFKKSSGISLGFLKLKTIFASLDRADFLIFQHCFNLADAIKTGTLSAPKQMPDGF